MAIKGLKSSSVQVGTTANDTTANYYFPSSLKTNGQDYIKFTAYEYVGGGLTPISQTSSITPNVSSPARSSGPNLSSNKGSVFLPIQSGISDSNMVSWGQDEMNAIDAAVAGAAYGAIDRGSSGTSLSASISSMIGGTISDIDKAARIAGSDEKNKDAIALYFAGRAANVNNLLARAQGRVINPNMELLFQGPALRPFNFNFRMTPRDTDEAMNIKDIIRFFKRKMAPIVDGGELFLKAPHVFKIEYIDGQTKGGLQASLNQIKLCALQSCSVDYTPDGNYSTFKDGSMTSYGLTLSFTELEPVYSKDYDDLKPVRGQIGY